MEWELKKQLETKDNLLKLKDSEQIERKVVQKIIAFLFHIIHI